MSSELAPTIENPFIFPISDKIKDEVVKQDVRSKNSTYFDCVSYFVTFLSSMRLCK